MASVLPLSLSMQEESAGRALPTALIWVWKMTEGDLVVVVVAEGIEEIVQQPSPSQTAVGVRGLLASSLDTFLRYQCQILSRYRILQHGPCLLSLHPASECSMRLQRHVEAWRPEKKEEKGSIRGLGLRSIFPL